MVELFFWGGMFWGRDIFDRCVGEGMIMWDKRGGAYLDEEKWKKIEIR